MRTEIDLIVDDSDTVHIHPRYSLDADIRVTISGSHGTYDLAFSPDKFRQVMQLAARVLHPSAIGNVVALRTPGGAA